MTAKEKKDILDKMVATKKKAEVICNKLNEAYEEEKKAKIYDFTNELEELVATYNAYAQAIAFDKCLTAEDPMMAAVLEPDFAGLKTRTHVIDKKSRKCEVSIEEANHPVSITTLHKKAKDGIGADKQWFDYIQKMSAHLAYKAAVAIAADQKDSKPEDFISTYDMSVVAQSIDLGKDPVGKKTMQSTVDKVVKAMIGPDYKARKEDVEWVYLTFCKKGRAPGQLVMSTNATMARIAQEMCNRIVTGENYSLKYKVRKEK